ncbi:MAG: TrmB family transcriptional regulator [Spirochaetota bacterium]
MRTSASIFCNPTVYTPSVNDIHCAALRDKKLLTDNGPFSILTTMVVNIVDDLVSLGLSEYEARAYIAIISRGEPSTAYEIAKDSSIPSSKIYEVMGRLIDREIAQPAEAEGTRRYTAIDPDEFLSRHRARVENSIARAGKKLAALKGKPNAAMIWNISEYGSLIEKSVRMVDAAEESVLLSVWKEEMFELYPALHKAEQRGVKIAAVHFGEPELSAGTVFSHPIADTLYAEKGGRGFALVADGRCALIGTVKKDGSVEGGWSESEGFITLTEDYIKHDIYIMKIVERYDSELISRFGDNYAMLRDIFSNREI